MDKLTINSPREELRACWRSLSDPMKKALDAAADKALRDRLHEWTNNGTSIHSDETIRALFRKGLIRVERDPSQDAVLARITPLGAAVFGSVGEQLGWQVNE